ncbi:DUF2808 domain-containing protein [Leptothermofonsia sp. ETS-13]|uniref:DUF2808 domain-containing protein n=1 Tax=Leptothermofonsia sp. ETS-13 TaxID=3035696 RepID=UPI003B9DE618
MRFPWQSLISTTLCISFFNVTPLDAGAIELADGTTYFLNPPRLLSAFSSQDGTYIWGATYYFTLNLPENAGRPLQKIAIVQEGGLGRPLFDADNTRAFEGTRNRPGTNLPIKQVEFNPDFPALTVEFEQPILPGTTVTIRLYPVRNPGIAGTYLYGVTAFPTGERPYGQYLGVGQIRIYDSNLD